jgi:uncharacterized protein YndB with AHSA1/START domain
VTELSINRTFDAEPARLWAAWSDPSELSMWFWPPAFETVCDIDPNVGGRVHVRSPVAGIGWAGEFVEVESMRRLAFSWQWDGETERTHVVVSMAPDGDRTSLGVRHSGFGDDATRDDHVEGWNDCLDRLPAHLASRV